MGSNPSGWNNGFIQPVSVPKALSKFPNPKFKAFLASCNGGTRYV